MWLGSHIAVVVGRPAAAVPIQPLAQEFPYAAGAALKRKKKKIHSTGCESRGRERKQMVSPDEVYLGIYYTILLTYF